MMTVKGLGRPVVPVALVGAGSLCWARPPSSTIQARHFIKLRTTVPTSAGKTVPNLPWTAVRYLVSASARPRPGRRLPGPAPGRRQFKLRHAAVAPSPGLAAVMEQRD